MRIEASLATHQGPKHEANEDTALVDDDLGLYVVADGLGGQAAGEIASRLAVEVVRNALRRSRTAETTWPFGIDHNLSLNANRLLTAVKLANRRVWKHADEHEDHYGMGTTIVAAIVDGGVVTVCSAGDSRAYLLRDGGIEQITEDDSWGRIAIAEGVMSEERVGSHPMRNMITSALGAAETIAPRSEERELVVDDVLLLCSDGLHRLLSDDAMLESVSAAERNAEAAVRQLMGRATAQGITDDLTAIVVRCSDETT